MTRDAGITGETGDFFADFDFVLLNLELVSGERHSGAGGDSFGEEFRPAVEFRHPGGEPWACLLNLAPEEGGDPVGVEFLTSE